MTLTAGGEDRVIIKGKDKVIRCLLERNIKCGRKSSALSVVVLLVKKKVAGNIHIFKRINHILLGKCRRVKKKYFHDIPLRIVHRREKSLLTNAPDSCASSGR